MTVLLHPETPNDPKFNLSNSLFANEKSGACGVALLWAEPVQNSVQKAVIVRLTYEVNLLTAHALFGSRQLGEQAWPPVQNDRRGGIDWMDCDEMGREVGGTHRRVSIVVAVPAK